MLRFQRAMEAMVVVLLVTTSGLAQIEDVEKRRQQELREFLDKTCKGFEITTLATKSKAKGEVVFRWDNPQRGSTDGCTALWYDKDRRPIAIASVYPINGVLHHDFDLLDRRAGARGQLEGKEFWRTPKDARVAFKPIRGVPKPAATKRARETQLKLIARQFSVDLLGWQNRDKDREPLRMLATPVHSYGSKKSEGDVVEGAIFLFVQGVDPEAALMIESHQHEGKYRWEYALIPQTSAALEAMHKKKVVWNKARNKQNPAYGYVAREIPDEAVSKR